MDLLNGLYGKKEEVNRLAENIIDYLAPQGSYNNTQREKLVAIKADILSILGVPDSREEARQEAAAAEAREAEEQEVRNREHRAEQALDSGTPISYTGTVDQTVRPGPTNFEGMGEAEDNETVLSIITTLLKKNKFIKSVKFRVGEDEVSYDAHRREGNVLAIFSSDSLYAKLVNLD